MVLVYKLIKFSQDLYFLRQAYLAPTAELVVFKKQGWKMCLHSLVIVLFLFISPVLIKLVNLHSHVPLLSQIKGLKKEDRTGRESQT